MIAFILTHWRTVAAIGAVAVLALLAWRINDLAYERGKADATARQIHIERGLTDEANRADADARRCAADPDCLRRDDGWRRD
ncbi:hypothetical protein ACFFJB_14885 [Camelimonas abortus]|uniref:Uncharacterized protein n=1 Tax=Camelimonas abortus TaxID=1017184 RepID=A0ABV7LIJ2_9HYPH